MSTQTVSLLDALAEIPDFRQVQGRRCKLQPPLWLACVAMLCGAKSESALAAWGRNYGKRGLKRLGFKRESAPNQPTICRVFLRLR